MYFCACVCPTHYVHSPIRVPTSRERGACARTYICMMKESLQSSAHDLQSNRLNALINELDSQYV